MNDALIVSALSLVPKHAVSGCMGGVARARLPRPVLRLLLRWYCWKYTVDLGECVGTLDDYGSLVDFFTRALRPGVRPVDEAPEAIVSPCDGKVYSVGTVVDDRIPQSDTQHFSARELVQGRPGYEGAQYAVLYLSPRDYHRVHTPMAGVVRHFQYVPGALWPVFPAATRKIPFLFSRNERLNAYLHTPIGEVAECLVGAFGVGRIRVVFSEAVSNSGQPATEGAVDHPLARAEEIGRFEMGSTVVLLFPAGSVEWTVTSGQAVRLGQRIAVAGGQGTS
ncbi:MAG: phosphatidylserine decarboxylase [Deltaproteobacteria bacterium]|nr:phosphatidylserine decarboxylase [Deltaproteobacteria bacterium]